MTETRIAPPDNRSALASKPEPSSSPAVIMTVDQQVDNARLIEQNLSVEPRFESLRATRLVNARELLRAMSAGEISLEAAASAIATTETQLELNSEFDDKSGLRTRKGLEAAAEVAVNLDRRNGNSTSVLSLDLDGFKDANDQVGHPNADHIIIAMGSLIRDMLVRSSDIGSRPGGDEFILFYPDTEADRVISDGKRLQAEVTETSDAVISLLGHELNVPITFSAGVVEMKHPQIERDELGETEDETLPTFDIMQKLLKDADETMYVAKKYLGKNKIAKRIYGEDEDLFQDTSDGKVYRANRNDKEEIIGIEEVVNG